MKTIFYRKEISMNIKELKEIINQYDNETEIMFYGWDEYDNEIGKMSFKNINRSAYDNLIYFNISK
jgi:hypothetical protein